MNKPELPSWLFVLTHPRLAFKTKVRQIEVSIEHAQSPIGTSIEDFLEMPLEDASRAIQLQDWPEKDQRLMSEGKLPRPGSAPEHPNI